MSGGLQERHRWETTHQGRLWRRTWDIWVLIGVVGGLQKGPVGGSR